MPRRRHENKARASRPLTLDELHMWDAPGVVLAEFGSADLAREEWERRGHLLQGNPGTRPEAWWTLFAPADLHGVGGPVYLCREDWDRFHRLQVARAAWMLEHPEHLADDPRDRDEFAETVRRGPAPWPDR